MTDMKKSWTVPIIDDLDIDPSDLSSQAGVGIDGAEFGPSASS